VNTQAPLLQNDEDGVKAAIMLWNSFLGGSGNRPFGEVKLDGVDIWMRDSIKGYKAMAQKLRELMNYDTSKTYYLAGNSTERF
jgi:hypothetical protein